ncbi:MAG: Rrf2 family transcriptional regulator [Leptolyngbya sp. PLA3]|nr:MAG: Rrf2 family transcriptional regulator [Cyanobacteria bacterium CYA]MCE7968827.1 Rrf2 family transcriptional regulator [Leptolyngbya sp. PL-A3]
MLSQAVGYAASALGYVAAAEGKPVLVREIADACVIPAPYLSKIIHTLAKQGLVITQRGVGGGVVLAREPTTISLYDLCRALGDCVTEDRCMLGTAACSDRRACPAHEFWCEHRGKLLAFLKATTVAEIGAFEAQQRAPVL